MVKVVAWVCYGNDDVEEFGSLFDCFVPVFIFHSIIYYCWLLELKKLASILYYTLAKISGFS